eukprot:TRINITY_DN39528_c0_g1_i2.p1 TRINITY_DN39528_c0_g1~~TRINITY_DN39528_c0_g1_i2.p1  ORF type:complete len:381 (-),score=65.50 TRINITY_DN39528_c0_g1_i2:200-1342(-)
MCIRDRYQRRVRGQVFPPMATMRVSYVQGALVLLGSVAAIGCFGAHLGLPIQLSHHVRAVCFILSLLAAVLLAQPRRTIAQQLHARGWADITLDPPSQAALRALYTAAEEFFAADESAKRALGEVRAVRVAGFLKTGLREQLEVRHDKLNPTLLSPPVGEVSPALAEAIVGVWPVLEELVVATLAESCTQLGGHPSAFHSAISGHRKRIPRAGELSNNSMRICRYTSEPPADSNTVCPDHTDVGFATLVLRSNVAGLECGVKSSSSEELRWYPVEGLAAGEAHTEKAVLLSADCLQVLTAGYFPAAPHRVVHNQGGRISISFHVYSDIDANLDPRCLPREIVGDNPPKPTRVAQVLQRKKRATGRETLKRDAMSDSGKDD